MGIERRIRFSSGPGPDWPAIASELANHGQSAVLHMIDGQLAFPGEMPGPAWQELRVGFEAGTITMRRDGTGIRCIAWGTGDPGLQAALDSCAEAVAKAGSGELDAQE